MQDRFEQYLRSIGLPTAFRDKVELILRFYQRACPEEIADVFICDYVKEDGSRAYTSLWLFSASYCMEADDFLDKNRWDMTPMAGAINRWQIESKAYDFVQATTDSRLRLQFSAAYPITGDLRASYHNCDRLRDILFTYIVPNMAPAVCR